MANIEFDKLHKDHAFVKQHQLDDYEIETSNDFLDYEVQEVDQSEIDNIVRLVRNGRRKKMSFTIQESDFLKLQEQSKKKGIKENELIEQVIHNYLLEIAS